MKGKKGTACNRNPTHRYPTRSSFRGAAAAAPVSHSQVSGAGQYIVQNQGLVACKKKRKREKKTPSLPKDIIFRILLLLPAKVLHEVMRYVCREWYDIVNDPAFIRVHLQMLYKIGILVQHPIEQDLAIYLELSSEGLELTELKIPFAFEVVSSCNGLLLLHDYTENPEIFHVVNLVTKVKVSLPPFERIRSKFSVVTSCLSYTSSGNYKVVYVSGNVSEIKMMVCTVGVDKAWRSIDLGNIPMTHFVRSTLLCCPRSTTAGSMYWNWIHTRHYGFALDVEGETICEYPAPEGYKSTCIHASFPLNMETSFGLATHCCETDIQEIWELIDVKSGKWAKVGDIDMKVLNGRLTKMIYPRTYFRSEPFYLKNGELWLRVLLFDKGPLLAYYNLWKGDILLCPIDSVYNMHNTIPHVNTLLSFKSC